ncbi:hypothetical protein BJX70DRAFT_410574 [Aspergillus crustosus]
MDGSDSIEKPFKVIIAGGSLVGLGLALAFERAGIDYELFEQGQFAPQLGASIGLHPQTLQVLDQLGVWQDIEKEIVPLRHRKHYDENGHCFESSDVLIEINRISKALGILYDHIQDKSKLQAFNGVLDYEERENSVVVTTQDGTDGIHSRIRKLMADRISTIESGLRQNPIEAFTSEYNYIFGVSKNDPANHFSARRNELPAVPARFTDNNAEALVKQYGAAQIGPRYTLRDLWDARIKATMAPLEEGVLEGGATIGFVLLGDSVHKATINPGLGGNLAYEGIAHRMNLLAPPCLRNILYHLPNSSATFAGRYIIPWVSDKTKANAYAKFSNGGPWLEYLPLPAVDAEHCLKRAEQSKNQKGSSIVRTVGIAAAVMGIMAIGLHKQRAVSLW